ncbi:hypothetical protein AB0891_02385 [Streptomyces sp. NPDC007259]|uniref:glycosyl hydrolase family 65 protein n=1 Tax=Streptomyces sp. NPDC007259 TaxID=3154319 RepID=UPI0034546F09
MPAGWDHFALQNVSYHGRELSVVYDRDGGHYRLGVRGLCVWVDGHLVASGRPLSGTTVDMRRAPVRRPKELANQAFNHKARGSRRLPPRPVVRAPVRRRRSTGASGSTGRRSTAGCRRRTGRARWSSR